MKTARPTILLLAIGDRTTVDLSPCIYIYTGFLRNLEKPGKAWNLVGGLEKPGKAWKKVASGLEKPGI